MAKDPILMSPSVVGVQPPLSSRTGNSSQNPQRRRRLGRSHSMHALLSQSMPRLLSSPLKGASRKDSVVWGNDSFSQIKLNFSLVSLDDDQDVEQAWNDLLKEIKHTIAEQTNRKVFMEQLIHSNLKMAKARYTGGSMMGAVLSMRKAHKDKTLKAYLAATRFQLIALRKEVSVALESGEYHVLDIETQRSVLHSILQELKQATCPMPSNEDLLKQLRSMMADGMEW